MIDIYSMTAEQIKAEIEALTGLIVDAVTSGASIGFMPPLIEDEAREYWSGVIDAVRDGSRVVLVATEAGVVQGSVQLGLEKRANGNHRCEAMKLFVHTRARRRGIAKQLMAEAEATAKKLGCTMMMMDTRKGGEADLMCQSLGYESYGEVPGYARSGDGELHTTVFYYRKLG
ncbi:MAG TPA: GNAT family N-acetyltransferase [Bryobacteraceae bacterium]|nr:GNAT family N-acetyltransferase [Bryobacteraceae bacterium]